MIEHRFAPLLFLGQTLHLLRDRGRLAELAGRLPHGGNPPGAGVRTSPYSIATSAAFFAQVGRLEDARAMLARLGERTCTTVPLCRMLVSLAGPLPALLEAFRTGAGVPYAAYDEDMGTETLPPNLAGRAPTASERSGGSAGARDLVRSDQPVATPAGA